MNKTQELKNYAYSCLSDIGKERQENEDVFLQFDSVNGSFFIVCDGMGGISGGKEAAEITISKIEEFVNEKWEENPKRLIKNAIEYANEEVFIHFEKENPGIKPGTTIVLVLIRDNKVFYAHVGDSRIYYQTGKKLFPITEDHSYVRNLVNKKIISEEEASTHSRRNEITKAIGINKTVQPTICSDPINPVDNDNILLCTDGLTSEMSDNEILDILLNNKSIEEKTKLLINYALENGGADNISVILVRFFNTGRDINKSFEIINKKKGINNKRLFFTILILFLSALIIFILNNNIEGEKIKKEKVYNSKTYSLIYKQQDKDTLINVFIKGDENLKELLRVYNLHNSEIGQFSGLKSKYDFIKYFIPVKVVYKNKVGKQKYTYPELNPKNEIDILIANKKNELYFFPGEKIIIPQTSN